MGLSALLGYIGGAMVAALQLPQVLHTRRTRRTAGLSRHSVGMHLATGVVWIAYGTLIAEIPIVLANVVYVGSNLYLLSWLRSPPAPAEGETGIEIAPGEIASS